MAPTPYLIGIPSSFFQVGHLENGNQSKSSVTVGQPSSKWFSCRWKSHYLDGCLPCQTIFFQINKNYGNSLVIPHSSLKKPSSNVGQGFKLLKKTTPNQRPIALVGSQARVRVSTRRLARWLGYKSDDGTADGGWHSTPARARRINSQEPSKAGSTIGYHLTISNNRHGNGLSCLQFMVIRE